MSQAAHLAARIILLAMAFAIAIAISEYVTMIVVIAAPMSGCRFVKTSLLRRVQTKINDKVIFAVKSSRIKTQP